MSWLPNSNPRSSRRNGLVAVAVDKDEGSQHAIKWTTDNLLTNGKCIVLIHVIQRPSQTPNNNNYTLNSTSTNTQVLEKHTEDLFHTFHILCAHKDIHCFDVVLEDTDIARAITEFVVNAGIENLVLGASCHGYSRSLQEVDVPSSVSKAAPHFCTVYVISRTKISSVRKASRLAPFASPLLTQIQQMQERTSNDAAVAPDDTRPRHAPSLRAAERTRCNSTVNYTALLEPSTVDRANTDPDNVDSSRNSRVSSSSGSSFGITPLGYRKYFIEEIEEATKYFAESRKIGEGGYGPVYKCLLNHTPVAIKILRPDATLGKAKLQQALEVLSCIRHPNMVLLLGACPEYGCLVYEYMANGSLEDCLFKKGNTRALSWQLRFRIAAEIASGLNFLHQMKPEPLVHCDLKPGNILLDQNYVSKIGDVGLARLVPPSVAEDVLQYRMRSTAGAFCYIDPEYQESGKLGVKSDVYSLGIVLLQILTGRPAATGLTHHIEMAIEKDTFAEILDPSVPDWPVEEALSFAKLALRCAERRTEDGPELDKVVVPELMKLRELGDRNVISRLMEF